MCVSESVWEWVYVQYFLQCFLIICFWHLDIELNTGMNYSVNFYWLISLKLSLKQEKKHFGGIYHELVFSTWFWTFCYHQTVENSFVECEGEKIQI